MLPSLQIILIVMATATLGLCTVNVILSCVPPTESPATKNGRQWANIWRCADEKTQKIMFLKMVRQFW